MALNLDTIEKVVQHAQKNRQSHIALLVHVCDGTRPDWKMNLLITKMVTGVVLPLSFAEGEGFTELMLFIEYKRAEKMHV